MLEWITNTINSMGYPGIVLLMFLENLFPPIPSEVIMPLAGFAATQGEMRLTYVVLAGTLGSLLGTLPWYYAGSYLGEERLKIWADQHGKWIAVSGQDVEKVSQWFKKYGNSATFFCRLVPGIRTLISTPAGASHMNLAPFLFYSILGTALWTGLLAYAGYLLGHHYLLVEQSLAPISTIVFVVLTATTLFWIVQRRKHQHR